VRTADSLNSAKHRNYLQQSDKSVEPSRDEGVLGGKRSFFSSLLERSNKSPERFELRSHAL
jgi:hypothetical protein